MYASRKQIRGCLGQAGGGGVGAGRQGLTPNGYEVAFWGNGNVLKLDCGAGYTTL